MAVSYAASATSFVAARPRLWSETLVTTDFSGYFNWDLAPDAKHVAVVLQPTERRLTFLLNFFDELERRSPPGEK
jgi:hypothetical protein